MARILVVEDETAIAELIAINLRHAGHEVTLAADGEQARLAIDAVLPDLVVLERCRSSCSPPVPRRPIA